MRNIKSNGFDTSQMKFDEIKRNLTETNQELIEQNKSTKRNDLRGPQGSKRRKEINLDIFRKKSIVCVDPSKPLSFVGELHRFFNMKVRFLDFWVSIEML